MSGEENTIEKMRLIYWELFMGNDPFTEVFTNKLPCRIILCPTEGYFLTEAQYLALIRTMNALGESSFFVSEVEGEPDFFNGPGHWQFKAEISYSEYRQLPVYLENAIYSESGNWGLIISHEEHALFGGSENVTRLFKDNLPNWEHGISQFTQKWEYNQKQYGSEVDWIPSLMSHIQGNDIE
jgi:hypothetical protein